MTTNIDLANAIQGFNFTDFTDKDKREVQQFIENERQKAKFQDNVHGLTATCWTRCIASNKISGPNLDKSESACLENCVNRFIDAQQTVMLQLDKLSGH